MIEAVARECKRQGMKLGLYYSLWDRKVNADVDNVESDRKYNTYMLKQLDELMDITEKYTKIVEFWFDGSWVKPGYRWPVEGIYRTIKSREPQCQIGINWTIGEDADPHNPNAPEKSYKIIPEEQKEGDPIRYFPSDFRLGDPLLPASLIREFDFKKNRMELVALHATGFGRPSQAAWTEIFADGQPLRIARWPNDSTIMIGKIQESGMAKEGKEAPFPVFGYQEERPSSWKSVENMWISGYFAHGYADDMICVESIDTIHKMIHTGQHTVYGFMTGAPWHQWFALNLLEGLDGPGEYVIDAGRGKMYVYPLAGKMENWSVSLLEGPLLAIEHGKDVKVQGITFEYGRHIGVYMENTHRALIKNCIIRNMGGVGVSIGKGTLKAGNQRGHESGGNPASRVVGDLMGMVYQNILFNREGGTENGVVDCHIYNVGAGGISLGGGDRASLTPAGNYVENCRIHDYNRIEKSYRPGIWMDGVGNRISKCDIYDAPSMAILFHGNNHVIELCDITNVCSEVDDQGAVYYGRDPSEQGNVIRYCYFHELSPHHRVTATYHDDGACGAEVYGNIYHKAGSLPVLIGGGHNNHYRHNIFIDSPVAIHIDARMQGWGKFMIEKGAIIDQRLQTVNYKNPPYSTAYPLLAAYWDNDTSYPKGNVIEENLFYKIGNVVHGQSEWLELYNNWATGSDPGFVDAADPLKGFKDDALIYQRINGFPRLPFEKIGCDLSK